MNLTCNNKGCLKTSEAKLDVKTMEVICQECGMAIKNISAAMKATLKQAGQIVRNNAKKAFMVLCKNCNANREVVLDEKETTLCKTCHQELKIPASFKIAMKEAGVKLETVQVDQADKAAKPAKKVKAFTAKKQDDAVVIEKEKKAEEKE